MRSSRPILLTVSLGLVLFLIVGGLAVKVGAGDNSFRQVVLFSEILSLVLDNYVDPVEAQKLLNSAYEGMLGGLDAHGAYLTPEEVQEWKSYPAGATLADPGITVLQAGRALQVVAVDPGSPAEEAGILVGDQIRTVDGRQVRELSLGQAWRLITGEPGSLVDLDLLHPAEGFRRERVEVERTTRKGRAFELNVDRGTALLKIRDLSRVDTETLAAELDDVRSRGVSRLLVDLRNTADIEPRSAGRLASLFAAGPLLRLQDRSGEEVQTLSAVDHRDAWPGAVSVLVNGATAGGAEAFASVIRFERGGLVLGEATYGLGSEARLYELEDGSGLLVSAAMWETVSGGRWNGDGLEPDQVIRGKGKDYEDRQADQLERALQFLDRREDRPQSKPEAA